MKYPSYASEPLLPMLMEIPCESKNKLEIFDAFCAECCENWFLVSHATQRSRCCLAVKKRKM
jgi:hypothetical protein